MHVLDRRFGPRLPSLLVERPRLTALLDEEHPLTILRAPAGFGKTTLVRQWIRPGSSAAPDRGETIAWLRVPQEHESDSGDLWTALARALRDAGVETDAKDADRHSPREEVRTALHSAQRPVLLLIDQFERVSDAQASNQLLELLRDNSRLRLVVCLQGFTHFKPVQHLDFDTTVIDADALRFSETETVELLEAAEMSHAATRGRAVHAECEGWPGLTRTALMNMRVKDNPAADSSAVFTGAGDYLDELLRFNTAPALGDFAMVAAAADPLPLRLMERLADDGTPPVQTWLDEIDGAGLLRRAQTPGPPAYTWSPLARQVLMTRFEAHAPTRLAQLRRQVAAWYVEQGEPVTALRYGLAAEAWDLVVSIIEANWRNLLLLHRRLLLEALNAAPDELIHASPLVRAVHGIRVDIADTVALDDLTVLPADPQELAALARTDDIAAKLDAALASVFVMRDRGWFDLAHSYAIRLEAATEMALTTAPARVARLRPAIFLQCGIARMLGDDLHEARKLLETAYAAGDDADIPHIASHASVRLMLLFALVGDPERTRLWSDRHQTQRPVPGWLGQRIDTAALIARALVAVDALDLRNAEDAIRYLRQIALERDEFWSFQSYAESLYALHANQSSSALRELSAVARRNDQRSGHGATAEMLLTRAEADLLLACGRGDAAARLIRDRRNHELLRVPRARLALLSGDPAATIRLAHDHHWNKRAAHRDLVTMLLLRAVAHHRLGAHEEAVSALRSAAAEAVPGRLLGPFAAAPHDLHELAAQVPQARELLEDPRLLAASSCFPERIELVALSDREQTVLEHLSRDIRLQDIAALMFVSPNTVKTHTRNLYRKLSVGSRDEAVARAAALGLLPDPLTAED